MNGSEVNIRESYAVFQRLSGKCIWLTWSAKNSNIVVFHNATNIDFKYYIFIA